MAWRSLHLHLARWRGPIAATAALLLVLLVLLQRRGHAPPTAAGDVSAAAEPRHPQHKPTITAPECDASETAGIEGCLMVSQACVDQQEVVMMGEQYQPDVLHPWWQPGAVTPLPTYAPEHAFYTVQYGGHESNLDFVGPPQPNMPPVPFRARSGVEATADLQDPQQYDNSTIPLVYHPVWYFNFAHTATASLSWIYNNINQSHDADLAERVRLVVRMPHGWAMPKFMAPLFQPLLRKPVTTLAELSARPAPGAITAAPRCFCRMLFCSSYPHTETPNVWHATQAVAAAYLPALPDQKAAAAAMETGRATPIQVVFHKRSVQVRQFSNLNELLEHCENWTWAPPAEGASAGTVPVQRAQCSSHNFTDLQDSIATAQATDIFVGVHGANIANGFFMRPKSALIEILHPDWPHSHGWYLEQDPTHEVVYFGLIVEASAWSPGAFELQQRGAHLNPYNGAKTGRDQNVNLRWEWLKPALDRIASLGGNMTAYRQIPQDQLVMHVP